MLNRVEICHTDEVFGSTCSVNSRRGQDCDFAIGTKVTNAAAVVALHIEQSLEGLSYRFGDALDDFRNGLPLFRISRLLSAVNFFLKRGSLGLHSSVPALRRKTFSAPENRTDNVAIHIARRHWFVFGRTLIAAARLAKQLDGSHVEVAMEFRDADEQFGGFCSQGRERPESIVGRGRVPRSEVVSMFHSLMALAWLLSFELMPQCTCLT